MSESRARSANNPLLKLRRLCLVLPEAHEVEAWGEPTFRVRNKLFAMYAGADTHHGSGRPAVWCNSTQVNQDLLIRSDSERFFAPPYVGPKGWIGMRLDKGPDWDMVAEIVRDAYLLTAPKKLAAALFNHRRTDDGFHGAVDRPYQKGN